MSESNLEGRAAIHDLFTRYCCALDNGEIEAVVDCFTVDAILKSPVIDISGHDEIRAFAGRFAAQRAAGTQFRHMVSNIAMTITGNRAAASAYLLVLISKDGNHRCLPPGRYACELIKEDSGQSESCTSCIAKEGQAISAGMLLADRDLSDLNGVILEKRYSRRAALVNLVVSPGLNRFETTPSPSDKRDKEACTMIFLWEGVRA